jgi:hypothetical protein
LSYNEQRTFMTLWCIFRSPLMVGGRIASADEWTLSLLTNPEVLAVDQHSSDSRPVISTDRMVVWRSKSEHGYYVAIFNISDSTQKLSCKWSELGIDGASYRLRDLWQRKDLGAADSLTVELPSHASVLYSVVAPKK